MNVLSLLLPDAASPPMARATQTSREVSTPLAIRPCSEGYNQFIWLHSKSSTTTKYLQTPRTIILQPITRLKRMAGGGPLQPGGTERGSLCKRALLEVAN